MASMRWLFLSFRRSAPDVLNEWSTLSREDRLSLPDTPNIRILRRRDVELICGLSKSTLYRLLAKGRFPQPVQLLNEYSVGWVDHEVQAWLADRVRERDTGSPRRRPPGTPRKTAENVALK